mgnify:CR=1 FL=1
MSDNLLTSKDILEKAGISRATLNNYIARGFLPKPLVSRPEITGSGPRQIGHFAPEVLERIELIQRLKKGGVSMDEIGMRLASSNANPINALRGGGSSGGGGNGADTYSKSVTPTNSAQMDSSESLTLTVEQLPHIAYMVNYKFEVLWLNEKARTGLPGLFKQMPPGTDDRSIFKLLMSREEELLPDYSAMLRLNLTLAKERMGLDGILMPLRGVPSSRLRMVEEQLVRRGVTDARVLDEITYSEAAELAYNGAKVLHPRTLAPLIERHIPVWSKNSFAPEKPGTRIVAALAHEHPGGPRAVTSMREVALISVEPEPGMVSGTKLMAEALEVALKPDLSNSKACSW